MPDDQGVELQIGDKTFLVTEDFKAAYDKQREPEEPKEKVEKNFDFAPPRQQDEAPKDGDIWSDPEGYLERYGKKIKEETLTELEKKKEQENKTQTFWNNFYSSNKDLKKKDGFVKYMANEKFQELDKIYEKEGESGVIEKLAEIVRDNLEIKPPKDDEPATPAILEGGPDFKYDKEEKPQEKVETMGDIMKKRRKKLFS